MPIEQLHRAAPDLRAQVRVAQRHLDRRVAHQLLHRLQWNAAHHQMRSERVPQDVPGDLAQPGPSARAPDRPLALVLLEGAAGLLAEDELASKVPLRLAGEPEVTALRDAGLYRPPIGRGLPCSAPAAVWLDVEPHPPVRVGRVRLDLNDDLVAEPIPAQGPTPSVQLILAKKNAHIRTSCGSCSGFKANGARVTLERGKSDGAGSFDRAAGPVRVTAR